MSYSITGTAPTVDEAKTKIAAEFDKIVAGQPVHEADRDEAQAVAETFLDKLASVPAKVVNYAVAGSVMQDENGIYGVSISVYATLNQPAAEV